MVEKPSDAPFEKQPLVTKRWLFLADKLEGQPHLLEIPLANIQKWIEGERFSDTRPLEQWRAMIQAACADESRLAELLQFLRKDTEETRPLKSCSPFAGVLTRDERDQFTCAWTH